MRWDQKIDQIKAMREQANNNGRRSSHISLVAKKLLPKDSTSANAQ